MSFEKSLKKGDIGEIVIQEYLEKKGWIVYRPSTDGAHLWDMFCTKGKDKMIALDVKTKARFNKWNAQGIDHTSYNYYLKQSKKHKIPFYLFFIDDKNGDVHLGDLEKLSNTEHFFLGDGNKKVIVWDLKYMKKLFTVSDSVIKKMGKFDQRNYGYNPE